MGNAEPCTMCTCDSNQARAARNQWKNIMAVCLIMQFAGMDTSKYDAVMEKLGLSAANSNWPKGIVSHVAGRTSEELCVVDVWESQQDFDAFMNSRLKPAFDAV